MRYTFLMKSEVKIPHYGRIKKIFEKHKVSFAYLFGSQAENRAIKSSDFDFAVYINSESKTKRFQNRLSLLQKLGEILPRPADVVVLNDTHSTTLRYSIVSEGKLIYEKNEGKRLDFELFTMNEYEEFVPFLKEYNKMYLREAI